MNKRLAIVVMAAAAALSFQVQASDHRDYVQSTKASKSVKKATRGSTPKAPEIPTPIQALTVVSGI